MKSSLAVLGAVCFVLPIPPAAAALRPFVLPPLWVEPETANATKSEALDCHIEVVPLTDTRAEPDVLGTLNGHRLQPPADRAAWLASMIAGLNRRGLHVSLNGTDRGRYSSIGITLQSAWVDTYEGGFTGVVAFEMNSNRDANPLQRRIVGRATTTDFIGTPHVRANMAFQRAVARALDTMAPVLINWCRASR